ncbi:MAG: histidinol dehydrogenase [Peptococcaceae bacterium]|jgi:histidinol dehydrogenase|nr:histidinol dehydrogenase [Peptococcaceae bacterium]
MKVIPIAELNKERLTRKSYGDDQALERQVREIIGQVRRQGDEALYAFTERFDQVDLRASGLRVSETEIEAAYRQVDEEFLTALRGAISNIRRYHEHQKRSSWMETSEDGTILGQLLRPLRRVGLYVPGGTAAYPSSVLMTAVPAQVAGVEELAIVSPPGRDGSMSPQVLIAAAEAGVREIYKIGGAQSIAALAYGTGQIAAVDKIAGPGNIFVTLAKKHLYGVVDIDMLAGPSEILILADESGQPAELAADLLSQAEHDRLASAILVSPDRTILERTVEDVERQIALLPRQEIARASWEMYGAAILVSDLEEGMALANEIGPEHLELVVREPFVWLGKVRNTGAVFLGRYTPEAVGDYLAGPSHVLPTGGTARFYSPLNVDTFMKKISLLAYSEEALRRDARQITTLARREGLEGHARSVEQRGLS